MTSSTPGPRDASRRAAALLHPSGFFVLRTPLLPSDTLDAWMTGLHLPTSHGQAQPDEAVAAGTNVLALRLQGWLSLPHVREALWLASPSVHEALDAWLADPRAPRARKAGEALVRYFVRMATRCTPFGLFSGCSTGVVGDETVLTLPGVERYRRHTRLDTHFLTSLLDALQGEAATLRGVRYYPNSSLIDGGERLRYVESRLDAATRQRSFHLVAARSSTYLQQTLERARDGATAEQLARALVTEQIDEAEALGFIRSLIDAQLLESELGATVTGDEPLDAVLRTLSAQQPDAVSTRQLASAASELRALDERPIGESSSSYSKIRAALDGLASSDASRLFQVDLYKPAPGLSLGRAVTDELASAVVLLSRITPSDASDELRRFQEAFEERYELAEVPLLEALDEERGVGFPRPGDLSGDAAPLLNELRLPEPATATITRHRARDERLVAAACERMRRGATEWLLSPDDIVALELDAPTPLPDAFAACGSLAAEDVATLERGEFSLYLRGIVGPSGATLLGRFCHGDGELLRAVRQHIELEERLRPDATFAEIVHLPEGRMGNILCRPLLREHEIPYLGRSGAPLDRQIPADDLTVSLRGGRIVLRSRSRDREVIPRLTTAHNFAEAELGVYRFLCRLQRSSTLAWSWGSVADTLPFLPRVRAGRSVLALARWRLTRAEVEGIVAGTGREQLSRVAELRERLALPRRVCLAEGDQLLWVDWDNPLSVQSFAGVAKSQPRITLVEAFPDIDQAVVRGPEGRFAHELVVPFVQSSPSAPAGADRPPARPASAPAPRQFLPGSDWAYAKIYCGEATADHVLVEVIEPLVAELVGEGSCDAWFFIRYRDPQPHLRVRFRGAPALLFAAVVTRLRPLLAPWVADGRVVKLQFDTYTRELERYGGAAGIELAEQLFHADSEAALALARLSAGATASDTRLVLALYGCYRLLADLGLPFEHRATLAARRRLELAREHRADAASTRQLGRSYRRSRAEIERWLARRQPGGDAAYAAFDRRSERLAPIARRLQERARHPGFAPSLESLAVSFLHMHVNRVLCSEQRLQEWVICDFLERVYAAERAQKKGDADGSCGDARREGSMRG